jgi:iron complex transport system substrate-binding protein
VAHWADLATSHPADILLYDQRPNSLTAEQLADIPAWSELPAVRAGRVLTWNPEPSLTFQTAAAFVNTVTAALRR